MRSRYIHHVTLTTGHTRRSWRHEIDPEIFPQLHQLIDAARADSGVIIPGVEPTCRLYLTDTARCALCSVRLDDGAPILTFAVADHQRCGAQLWEMLHDTAATPLATTYEDRPETPWCAVRIERGAILFPPPSELLPTLADMERCIALAWLENARKK